MELHEIIDADNEIIDADNIVDDTVKISYKQRVASDKTIQTTTFLIHPQQGHQSIGIRISNNLFMRIFKMFVQEMRTLNDDEWNNEYAILGHILYRLETHNISYTLYMIEEKQISYEGDLLQDTSYTIDLITKGKTHETFFMVMSPNIDSEVNGYMGSALINCIDKKILLKYDDRQIWQ